MPPKTKPSKKKCNKRKEEKHEPGEPSHKRKRNNATSLNNACPSAVPPPSVNPQSATVDAPQFHNATIPNVAGHFQRPPMLPNQLPQQQRMLVPSGVQPPRFPVSNQLNSQMIGPSYRPPIQPGQQLQQQRMILPIGDQPPRLPVLNQQGNQMARPQFQPPFPPGQHLQQQRMILPIGGQPPRLSVLNQQGNQLPPVMNQQGNQMARPQYQPPIPPGQQRMNLPIDAQPLRLPVLNQQGNQMARPQYQPPIQPGQQLQQQRMILPIGAQLPRLPNQPPIPPGQQQLMLPIGAQLPPVMNQQGNQMARPPYQPPMPPGQQRMILPIGAQPPRLPVLNQQGNQMARPPYQPPFPPGQQLQQRLQFVPSGVIPPRVLEMINQCSQMAVVSYGPPSLPGQHQLVYIRPSYGGRPIIPGQQPQPQRMFVPSGVQPPRLSAMNQQGNQMRRPSYRPPIPLGQPPQPQRMIDPSGARPPAVPQINLQNGQISGHQNTQLGLLMLRIKDSQVFCARVFVEPGFSSRQMPPEAMNPNLPFTHPIVHFNRPNRMNGPPTTSDGTQPGRYYRCMDCLERFPTMTKLDNHRRIHQSKPEERRIKCWSLKCVSWLFEDFDELDDHFREHHMLLNLRCAVCDESFVNSWEIIKHRQAHF